eukprot:9480817-Pyramimonas_sp.AAC.1
MASNEAGPCVEMNRCMGPMTRELGGRVCSNIVGDPWVCTGPPPPNFSLSHPEASFSGGPGVSPETSSPR